MRLSLLSLDLCQGQGPVLAGRKPEIFVCDEIVMPVVDTERSDLSSFSHLHVLIVDDDEFMLEVIGMTLKRMAIGKVATSSSGSAALHYLDSNCVDVILCDLNMPGMDGVELIRHLAGLNFSGGILLISSEDKRILKTAMALAQAHHLNMIGGLQKPVSMTSLAEILSGLGNFERKAEVSETEISAHELVHGINKNEFMVHYQPKVDISSEKVVGVEGLVRWNHPLRGMLMPDKFISVCEETGLIEHLTDQVIVRSLRDAGSWMNQGLDIKVAINISVNSLHRLDLPEFIVASAEAAGFDTANIMLEITESRIMDDVKAGLDILTRLGLKKIGLSIDDFGTGYSTLGQLQQFPFVELKIDRSFVNGAYLDESAKAILKYSVELAKKLDMRIVAEGVETRQDWDLVKSLGCDMVQGYYVARPMPEEELLPWIIRWNRKSTI